MGDSTGSSWGISWGDFAAGSLQGFVSHDSRHSVHTDRACDVRVRVTGYILHRPMGGALEFDVEMTCQKCVKKVENALQGVDAVSIMEYGSASVRGLIRFVQTDTDQLVVDGTIDGLAPGKHALCVHECGDVSEGCNSRLKVWELIGRSMIIHQASTEILKAQRGPDNRITCGIIARSAGLFQNAKKICACDGVTQWDERNVPVAGKGRQANLDGTNSGCVKSPQFAHSPRLSFPALSGDPHVQVGGGGSPKIWTQGQYEVYEATCEFPVPDGVTAWTVNITFNTPITDIQVLEITVTRNWSELAVPRARKVLSYNYNINNATNYYVYDYRKFYVIHDANYYVIDNV
ncbi:CCS-like protein [Mya arenaria]|uniref:Superoxide dismutase copper chaperone n=1 Tax=Mya arenaria TaxID=6604 RepID=A0ABY7FBW6_MYAAR|nr:CCS-like protein [Mya arenaria]